MKAPTRSDRKISLTSTEPGEPPRSRFQSGMLASPMTPGLLHGKRAAERQARRSALTKSRSRRKRRQAPPQTPSALGSLAGAGSFGPPLATPTRAGRGTRSPMDVARLHDLDDGPGRHLRLRHLEHRLMPVRVEVTALRLEAADAVALKGLGGGSRSVSSKPSSEGLQGAVGAGARASAGRALRPRRMLSETVSMSRAKFVTA